MLCSRALEPEQHGDKTVFAKENGPVESEARSTSVPDAQMQDESDKSDLHTTPQSGVSTAVSCCRAGGFIPVSTDPLMTSNSSSSFVGFIFYKVWLVWS